MESRGWAASPRATRNDSVMIQDNPTPERQEQAIDWFVRLQDCEEEAVWHAHRDWLEANPANAAAYAEVAALWVDLDRAPLQDADAPATPQAEVIALADHPRARARWRFAWIPVAVAATVAAYVATPQIQTLFDRGQTYRTDATHTREIALADGSHLLLNRNTEITVRLSRADRSAVLASGEVAFDIHHERDRPFHVTAGGRDIRVLGTEFNVLSQAGAFAVTVRRGLVAVSRADDRGNVIRLPAGLTLRGAGEDSAEAVSAVAPDNAFAWRTGKLIYDDSPFADVARDLSRYSGARFTVARPLRALHVTAVLTIGDERSMRHQVQALLPVAFEEGADGERRIVSRPAS